MKIPKEFKKEYTRTNYRVVGKHSHSAIKPCYWMEQRLLTGRPNRNCYKGYFGIESHLCLQNTPALPFCPHRCVFCWRDIETGTLGDVWPADFEYDEPGYLVDEMIRHQINLLDHHLTVEKGLEHYEATSRVLGYMLGHGGPVTEGRLSRELSLSNRAVARSVVTLKNAGLVEAPDLVNYSIRPGIVERHGRGASAEDVMREHVTTPGEIRKCHEEAHNPRHAAISLAGEPTLYPQIGEFVREFRRRGFTTFIVTNGVFPEIIESWSREDFPTQLYVSLPAYSRDSYRKICRSSLPDGWDRLVRTLDLLEDLPTRTVLRLTVLKGINDAAYDQYAALVRRADPNFVDLKGFTTEGFALEMSRRMGDPGADVHGFFPEMDDLRALAGGLEARGAGTVAEEVPRSRDVLLRVNWPESKSLLIDAP
ncbi:MAG: radical SAM protein [Promethearchaeota archaeon]